MPKFSRVSFVPLTLISTSESAGAIIVRLWAELRSDPGTSKMLTAELLPLSVIVPELSVTVPLAVSCTSSRKLS